MAKKSLKTEIDTPGTGAEAVARDDVTRNDGTSVSTGSGTVRAAGDGVVSPEDPTRVSTTFGSESGSGDEADISLISELPEETIIAGYRIEQEIHRGGQGIVYRATQLGTKRQVALKVLLEGPFAGETARRRFEREIELAASFQHPNIVTILDSGRSFGRYYFAMEYVDGIRLDRYLGQHRPPLKATLRLFQRVCDAVNYAHQRGVLHRDLKPSNILVDKNGEPRVLDFGLAKQSKHEASENTTVQMLSTTGQIVGTVAFMSPEQARGEHDVDLRSDVYSLGVLFYEALLGAPPYPVTGPLGDVLNSIVHNEPVRPRSLRARSRFGNDINDELETILLKALEKDRTRRYQTAGELGRDLAHLLAGEPIEAKRASGWYILRKLLKRHKVSAAAGAAVLVMLLGFMIALAVLYNKESMARKEAESAREYARSQAQEARRLEGAHRIAREEAEDSAAAALAAQADMQRALSQQRIERGNLALERGGLTEARDSYWDAYLDNPSPAAQWALRQYYMSNGDAGSWMLYPYRDGPLTTAPAADIAAVVELSSSISIRALGSGELKDWYATPSTASVVALSGAYLLAAGDNWLWVWELGSSRPIATTQIGAAAEIRDLRYFHVAGLMLVTRDTGMQMVRVEDGAVVSNYAFRSAMLTQPDYDSSGRRALISTQRDVYFVEVSETGGLTVRSIYESFSDDIYDARFVNDREIALLTRNLYTAMLDDLTDLDWEVAVTLDDRWEMLRFAPTGTLAVAKRTGEVAVYERKALIGNWRTSLSGLQDFWFDSDRRALLTLRGDGGVTAWGTSSASEQRRGLSSKPIAQWALATNGSTAVFSDPAGVTRIYRPDVSPDPYRILEGKVFSFQLGATPNVTMGVSHDGRRAAVNKGSTLRLIEMSDAPRPPSVRTYQHINSQFEHLALNRDGSMIAIHAPSADGELQWLTFHRWGAGSAGETRETRPDLAELSLIANPISFVGASIKHLAFLPGTSKLLVARSNGEIIIIDPAVLPPRDVSLQADETPAAPPPWLVLDSPAVWLAFSRDADSLAVVSEDGILRVISMETGQLQQRIRVGEDVTSISFDSAGDSLLLRESTGVISIIDIASSEKVATLNVAADRAANAAFWMGEKDRLIVSDGRVLELRYQNVDDAIARNRMSAIERKAILHLRLDDFDRATALLAGLDAEKYPSVEKLRSDIFAAALQRPGYSMPPAWLAIVREATARPIRLRFGHVAYEGNQFQLAGTLLRELVSSQLEQFGSITIRRLAECEYLLERYAEATALFKEVVTRGQFAPSIISTVQLEQAAAALLSGDPDSAKKIVLKIGSAEPENMRSLGTQSAVTVGSYLVGLQTETFLTAGIKQLMKTFAEDSLSYHDDAHFFLGELARVGGNRVEAASRYQRCIDLSRDVWPANWARYRLLQMAQQFQKS